MTKVDLEERLKQIISNVEKGKIDKEVISFTDYKSKYAFIKKSVFVTVELTDGKTAKIDISDYFKEDK